MSLNNLAHKTARAIRRVGSALPSAGKGGHDLPYRSFSYRSRWSVLSASSLLSVASAASMLSIGSFASILSIGSSNSVLSIGSDGGFLSIGASRRRRLHGEPGNTGSL